MLEAFHDAVKSVASTPEVRVLVVGGAGKAFCAGLDLKEMGLARRPDGSVEYPEIEGALHELERCPVPTIAMMQGDAIAGGLELALHCDLRVAGAGARMGMPLAKIGLVVPFPLTQKLLDTVGTVRTKEMLFTGSLLDARALAADIAANAPLSLRTMKAAINEANGFRNPRPSPELAAQAAVTRKSEDLQEGLRAVFEKRRAVFHGR
jgi:enoyl-CoA hydratase/carnithine racemase